PYIDLIHTGSDLKRSLAAERGPGALAWALHHTLISTRGNAVVFTSLEHLLQQPRLAAAIPRLLANLTRSGLLVWVHGTSEGLKPIDEIADYTGQGSTGHVRADDLKETVARDYRAMSAWAKDLPGLSAPPATNAAENERLRTLIKAADERIAADDLA